MQREQTSLKGDKKENQLCQLNTVIAPCSSKPDWRKVFCFLK